MFDLSEKPIFDIYEYEFISLCPWLRFEFIINSNLIQLAWKNFQNILEDV